MDCNKPEVKDLTNSWNNHDEETVKDVNKSCKRLFGPEYCARVILKTGENSYKVRCYNPEEDGQ